jgi:hypothetical protein
MLSLSTLLPETTSEVHRAPDMRNSVSSLTPEAGNNLERLVGCQ